MKISEFRRTRSRKYSRRYYGITDQRGSSADPLQIGAAKGDIASRNRRLKPERDRRQQNIVPPTTPDDSNSAKAASSPKDHPGSGREFESVPTSARASAAGITRRALAEADGLFDNMLQRCVFGRQRHAQSQLEPLDFALTDDALDLALRGDANFLEKFAHAILKLLSSIAVPQS